MCGSPTIAVLSRLLRRENTVRTASLRPMKREGGTGLP
jgi:hypothetical protein